MQGTLITSSVRVGVETLRSNLLRTILSTLGVILGVASLVAVLSIGDGLEQFARSEIEQTTDLQSIIVSPTTQDRVDGLNVPRADFARFTLADADSLGALLGPGARVAIAVTGASRASRPGVDAHRAAVITATTPPAEERLRLILARGRFFSEGEVRGNARVAVISHGLAVALAGGVPSESLVDADILLEGTSFRVIGVTAASPEAEQPAAYVPYTSASLALAQAGHERAPLLFIRAVRVEAVAELRQATEEWLAQRGGAATVDVQSPGRLAQAKKGIVAFKLAMGAFAGISIIVGGIGIMNVLLAAVTERTREIGIRKATGARDRDILTQFLAESVAICGAGSVLGVMLGLAGAFGVTALMRSQTEALVYAVFTWATLAVAAAVSIVTGLVFGTYPALRAARLSPIEAIRRE